MPQPGKSGTKKADEIYHFLSLSSFLIVLFRIFRESDQICWRFASGRKGGKF
uniref:Uncharacterized protein n=1 Tax=Candidatus Kentrum sp. LPFa TaxID=2126335 RepID=A0A450XKX9_9GAMM|nr:MAG: hypothetical protein BECKLPF1236A_GA0070988_101242 [Candidatus Kentron sp. LPFa]VFK29980.1 MAG: hypothetical protein BECKLPF1236C_GA0070990_101002 [Candidatus Kentron sp. LPFa]